MYDTPPELLEAIAAGEDTFLELKLVRVDGRKVIFDSQGQATSWLARQLSAFLNTEGGTLVLGVADDRSVVGIDPDRLDDVQRFVTDVARNNLEPPGDHLLSLDALALPTPTGDRRLVLKVDVRQDLYAVHAPKGHRPYTRVGSTTREVSMEQLPRLLARRDTLAPADERPVLAAGPDDLDWDGLASYHQRRLGRDVQDLTRFARNVKVLVDDELGEPHPTIAGLLVFGVDPQAHLPYARLDLAAYHSLVADTDRRVDAERYGGSAAEQIEGVTRYVASSPFLPVASRLVGVGREDLPGYADRAVREAVVNAVAHRDYGLAGAQVRVQLFPDRIEVTSPGRLPNSLMPEDLFAGAQPVRRNQVLVGFLSDPATVRRGRAPIEGMGEGFLTIVRESERLEGGRTPELRQHTDAVTLTIYRARPQSVADPWADLLADRKPP